MNFKIYKYTIALAALGIMSCTKKFDTINTNPDKSTSSRADWLAASIISASTDGDISDQKAFMQPFMLSKYILWTELQEGYQYNSLGQTGSWGRYNVLRNIDPMLQYAASDPDTYPSYRGLAHFIRAWQFYQLTMQVGDIPYSEALKGKSEGNIKPKYDNQKDVFKGILSELDSANVLFSTGKDFSGDIVYKGSVDKWRRVTNTFELYVLINLYRKTTDADLNVVEKFKDIVANRPLMRDYTDNFAITYINSAGYCYPWSSTPVQKNQFTIYPMVSTTLIDLLKTNNDRRLFYYAEPAASAIDDGLPVNNFNAYIGVEPADPYSNTTSVHSAGMFSDVNKRYVDLYNAEPVSLISYWDQQFILAEAAVRGWITGTPAQDYYASGIKSSMNFLTDYTPETYTHEMAMDDSYINNYPATVALTGTEDNQVKQIITQKYIAGFLHGTDYNAWYEFRRTGYPQFTLNPNTNLNTPGTEFPVRWKYPQVELNNNGDNYKTAIQSQYGGNDDVTQLMWLLK
jgi:hypothetical protein